MAAAVPDPVAALARAASSAARAAPLPVNASAREIARVAGGGLDVRTTSAAWAWSGSWVRPGRAAVQVSVEGHPAAAPAGVRLRFRVRCRRGVADGRGSPRAGRRCGIRRGGGRVGGGSIRFAGGPGGRTRHRRRVGVGRHRRWCRPWRGQCLLRRRHRVHRVVHRHHRRLRGGGRPSPVEGMGHPPAGRGGEDGERDARDAGDDGAALHTGLLPWRPPAGAMVSRRRMPPGWHGRP